LDAARTKGRKPTSPSRSRTGGRDENSCLDRSGGWPVGALLDEQALRPLEGRAML